MKHTILFASALLLSGVVSAQAGEMGAPQMVVSYSDLNVQQSAGAQILYARIDAAAQDVCGPAPSIGALDLRAAYKACVSTAKSQAVASLPFNLMARLEGKPETLAQN